MRKGFCFFTNESSGPLGPTALRIVTAVLQSPQWQTRPVHHNRCTGLAMYKARWRKARPELGVLEWRNRVSLSSSSGMSNAAIPPPVPY